MSMESRRLRLEGKKMAQGEYAYIKADKVGWWITFVTVRPNGTASKTGHAEAYRKYDTYKSLIAGLKKAPYHVDFFKRGDPPAGIY